MRDGALCEINVEVSQMPKRQECASCVRRWRRFSLFNTEKLRSFSQILSGVFFMDPNQPASQYDPDDLPSKFPHYYGKSVDAEYMFQRMQQIPASKELLALIQDELNAACKTCSVSSKDELEALAKLTTECKVVLDPAKKDDLPELYAEAIKLKFDKNNLRVVRQD
nr:hypothetical protein CFP56_76484 [Quercus suber]